MKGKQKPIRRAPSSGVVDPTIVTPAMKMRPRHRLMDKTLREIRKYQKSTELLLPRAPFRRIVKEIVENVRWGNVKATTTAENEDQKTKNDQNVDTTTAEMRISPAAICALQEAAEVYLVNLFADSNMVSSIARRVTLYQKDMDCAFRIGERIKQPVIVQVGSLSKKKKRRPRKKRTKPTEERVVARHPSKRPRTEKPTEKKNKKKKTHKIRPAPRVTEELRSPKPRMDDFSSDDGRSDPDTPTDARMGEASD